MCERVFGFILHLCVHASSLSHTTLVRYPGVLNKANERMDAMQRDAEELKSGLASTQGHVQVCVCVCVCAYLYVCVCVLCE